jgi:hypothetical protein
MKDSKEKYEMMQTKVSPETFKRIKQIEEKLHMKSYGIIQMMVDCIVRYMDDRHNLTPEMEQAMSIFEHMVGWAQALNLADPTVAKEIGEATYYMYDKDGKKKGVRGVHITRPYFTEWKQDFNIQHILERNLELLIPETYERMRRVWGQLGFNSMLEFFNFVVDHFSQEEDIAELRHIFEDAARADNGKEVAYGQRTRKKKRGDIEDMPSLFDADGLEEHEGYQPHGDTW